MFAGQEKPATRPTVQSINVCLASCNVMMPCKHHCIAAQEMFDALCLFACLQDADKTDIYQISRNWADLVKRARVKKLAPDEFNSGTFTVSNLGMYGADTFDAILPPGKHSTLHACLTTSTSKSTSFLQQHIAQAAS